MDCGITCTCCISVFEWKLEPKLREMVLVLFSKWNSFNTSRKHGTFGIDLVESILNTLHTLELPIVSQLFISILKHYLTQWSPNITQWSLYETIVKYVIWGPECATQWINTNCAKFHIFSHIIKGVPFPERSKYHLSQL